jgi:hypothetical protein
MTIKPAKLARGTCGQISQQLLLRLNSIPSNHHHYSIPATADNQPLNYRNNVHSLRRCAGEHATVPSASYRQEVHRPFRLVSLILSDGSVISNITTLPDDANVYLFSVVGMELSPLMIQTIVRLICQGNLLNSWRCSNRSHRQLWIWKGTEAAGEREDSQWRADL